ncbi:sugar porter family MFS transporter [Aspergillus lucknowensis]|uniref:General substrate transporter n=1 Tax=Aspergillus lucknowensis TaxID=176173 RepID=A0ABR4LM27_9EURO
MSPYAQVPQSPDPDHDHGPDLEPQAQSRNASASLRIYWLAAIVCCGGLLFGYDSGVIGGVLIFDSFRSSFQYTPRDQTSVSAIAVGIQQAGALVGCLLIWPLTTRHGRRRAMMLCSLIFCAGVLFEIINSRSLLVFYIGRVICGLGVGGAATVSPIYLAEMSPKHLRGRLGSGYQFTFTIGIFVSYWVDYALQFRDPTALQWQIPLALQLIPGIAMGAGMMTLNESVRWLLDRGQTRDAWESLIWVRGSSGPDVREEFAEMKRAVEADTDATADFHPRELLHGPNLHRVLLAVSIFLAQQATGATAMAYFGPQFFGLLVGDTHTESESASTHSLPLLLTGIFGALKVLSCLVFIIFVADRFGRKPLLTFGALGMAICMISTSLFLRLYNSYTEDHSSTTTTTLSAPKILTILLIYTSITSYNLSWGPLPWPLAAELFPTRIRSPGVALGVASQWLSNFAWSFATPYILAGLGWATFLLFGILDLGIAGFVVGLLPETGGKTLEEIEALFEGGIRRGGSGRAGDDGERERLVGGLGGGSEDDEDGKRGNDTIQGQQS